MSISFVLIGSNLGNTFSNLQQACDLIQVNNIELLEQSFVYQTKAWGNTNQADFLNAVLKLSSNYGAKDLLDTLLNIELLMGRKRGEEQWMPRLIDIDILYFNDEIINLPNLKIPHPYIAERKFTLIPLNDLAPNFIHPLFKISNQQLLLNCKDSSPVVLTNFKLSIAKSPIL